MFRKISPSNEVQYPYVDLKNKQTNAFQKSMRQDGLLLEFELFHKCAGMGQ